MSLHARDGVNANSALVVQVPVADFGGAASPLAGVAFQRDLERRAFEAGGGAHVAPAQRVGDFREGRPTTAFGTVKPSFPRGVRPGTVDPCLPPVVAEHLRRALPVLDGQMRGFADPDAVLTGVETRTSSPVRIPRGEDGQASVAGLFPAGEGAGYAGGIVSAAVDGIRAAEAMIARFRPG
jgi:uncharacterized protein